MTFPILQSEAKRKKFKNQDSVISEKFASRVCQDVVHHALTSLCRMMGALRPRTDEMFVLPACRAHILSLSLPR